MTQLILGQKVWVKPSSLYRGNREPYEATVTKIGKKYFYINNDNRYKFSIETLKEVSDSNYLDTVYLSLQQIQDEQEFNRLSDCLKKIFTSYYLPKNYTLNQLREVAKILSL